MATPPAPNQFQQQQPVQQPVQQYGVDQMQGQFQQMNVGGVGPTGVPPTPQYPYQQPGQPQQSPQLSYDPYQPQPQANTGVYGQGMGGVPPSAVPAGGAGYGGYGQQNNIGLGAQLNALYTTDLSRDLPPPIAELSFQPPPITLPDNATLIPASKTANATPEYFRSTLNVVPTNSSLLKKSKLPLAIVVNPYNALKIENENVPVTCDTVISRCRRCRGYINPFVTLAENGRRWRCNFCNLLNDIPSAFDYDEISGQVKTSLTELN